MRRAGFLFDAVIAWPNLLLAVRRASRGKRRRHEVARFLFDLEPELLSLQRELATARGGRAHSAASGSATPSRAPSARRRSETGWSTTR